MLMQNTITHVFTYILLQIQKRYIEGLSITACAHMTKLLITKVHNPIKTVTLKK